MSTIWHLIRRDLRRATSNVMAIIVVFGLVIIPSLVTWFNVIASWDPFSNTSSLKIAVASADEGYQSDLVPIRLNLGEQVLSALRGNDQLDWVITTEDDAVDGAKSGEYYAALVLPKSFSADMMTFYVDGAETTDIAYYTNQKKNALAPKITDQGAEGVSAQISEVFTKTLGEIALGVMSSVSDYLTDDDTQAALARLESRVAAVSTQLRSGAGTADMFTALIETSLPLVDSASALVAATGASFDDASDAAGGGLEAAKSLNSTLGSAAQSLAAAIASTIDGYTAVGDSIDDLFTQAGTLSASQAAALDTTAEAVQQQIDGYTAVRDDLDTNVRPLLPETAQDGLDDVIARIDDAIARQQSVHDALVQAADDIEAGAASAQESHNRITAALEGAQAAIEDAKTSYEESLKPKLDQLSSTLATIGSDIDGIREDLGSASSRLSGASGDVRSVLQGGAETTAGISEALTSTADKLDELQSALAKAADTGDFSEISEVIGADPAVLATSLAEPVRVDRIAVFPVAAFGAAMVPLYTILALWVGALLMTVAVRVDVNAETLPGEPEPTPTQKYLGRYGVFAVLGLAQSTLLLLGLELFVQIQAVHPLLLLLAGWVTSVVFTLIIYTAVVAFGNAGKALSVLLLVIQISGSGGAYPLQLLPQWFQSISPFLPATHAINAMRSAIAGVYAGDYWISLGLLAAFIVPALLLGLVLRRPLMSSTKRLSEALESTKLM